MSIVHPCHCIRVASQSIFLLEEVDFVLCVAERPEGGETGNTASDYCYALSFHLFPMKGYTDSEDQCLMMKAKRLGYVK